MTCPEVSEKMLAMKVLREKTLLFANLVFSLALLNTAEGPTQLSSG